VTLIFFSSDYPKYSQKDSSYIVVHIVI